MRRIYLLLITMMLSNIPVLAQWLEYNEVYSSTSSPIRIPSSNTHSSGKGTRLLIKYHPFSNFNKSHKSAIEYACRMVEGIMPATYNINVVFKIDNNLGNNVLAYVETPCYERDFGDRVYLKRWYMSYDQRPDDIESLLGVLRDSTDIEITFASAIFRNCHCGTDIDVTSMPSNKYDLVTITLQALLKGVGFMCQAERNGNELTIPYEPNQFTHMLLFVKQPAQRYTFATSDNAVIWDFRHTQSLKLYSPTTYQQGKSLNYCDYDPNNTNTAIMQFGISKGTCIRNLGNFMDAFFSFCGWDDDYTVSVNGDRYYSDATDTGDALPFAGFGDPDEEDDEEDEEDDEEGEDDMIFAARSEQTESEADYIDKRREKRCPDGKYVLLANGAWERFTSLRSLTQNERYARSVDGYLRLKEVTTPSYNYHETEYKLYNYIPQEPDAAMNQYTVCDDTYGMRSFGQRGRMRTMNDLPDDVYVEVEIGIKNLEGTTDVLVEQTDSDYPIPYTYYVDDPKEGTFVAYMNKNYPSTFRLTYINSCGQTVGEPFTIDLSEDESGDEILSPGFGFTAIPGQSSISYNVSGETGAPLSYTISNMQQSVVAKRGEISDIHGSIDISALNNGMYVMTVFCGNKKVAELKWNKR